MVHIAELNAEQLGWLRDMLTYAEEQEIQFRLAFDPIDNSIKWQMGAGVWSPPVRTEER